MIVEPENNVSRTMDRNGWEVEQGSEFRLSCWWTKQRIGLLGNLYGKRREVKKKRNGRIQEPEASRQEECKGNSTETPEWRKNGVMEYWKEEKTPAFAKASAFVAILTSADKMAWQGRQNEKQWKSGRTEHWKNGVLEYWSDGVLERGEDSRLSTLRPAACGTAEDEPQAYGEARDSAPSGNVGMIE
jgi:hypothetical protein